jgi:hypothetical protein
MAPYVIIGKPQPGAAKLTPNPDALGLYSAAAAAAAAMQYRFFSPRR